MSSVEEIFIDQLKTSLDSLVTNGVLKRVYTEPVGVMSAKEFPFVFFRIAADDEYDLEAAPPQARVGGRFLVTIILRRDMTYALRELVTLKAKIRNRLVLDMMSVAECQAQIMTLRSEEESRDSNLSYEDFAMTTIAINYHGIDRFSESGINA